MCERRERDAKKRRATMARSSHIAAKYFRGFEKVIRRTVSRVLSSLVRVEAIIPLDGGLLRNSSSLTRGPDGRADRVRLFGLAPGRVCHATSIAGSAVSSYLTVSPLPCSRLTEITAVSFLLHCP